MNLKKLKIFGVIILFLLAFPLHFIYDFLPVKIVSIFAPVNESIWEHMKILFSCHVIYSFIEYFIIKNKNIKVNNIKSNALITSVTSIPIYLILFLPLYKIFGENMTISLSLMLLTFIITQIISYKIYTTKELKILNKISIPLIIICYIIFTILTYFPPNNELFFDTINKIYGIR